MARYLLDTDVMIDVSRGNADVASYIDSLSDAVISIHRPGADRWREGQA